MTSPNLESPSPVSADDRYRLTPKGEQLARDLKEVEAWFSYHTPTVRQKQLLEEFNSYIIQLAKILVINLKPSRERSIALTELREARMKINQAIVFDTDE